MRAHEDEKELDYWPDPEATVGYGQPRLEVVDSESDEKLLS